MKTEIGTDLNKAKTILENGGLVAIPTETVYGLAANALNSEAVSKIFEAKDRPYFDPLIVHIEGYKEIKQYAVGENVILTNIAKKLWPGPLTILVNKSEKISDIVTSGLERVGLRVPDHPLTLELLAMLDFPVAAPSANPFNYVSPTSAKHVYDQLSGKIDYILDGGKSTVGVESTIIGFEEDGLVVYRKGGVEIETLKELYTGNIRIQNRSESNPSAPGMLKKHYSPKKRMLLFDNRIRLADLDKERVGFLRFKARLDGFSNQFVLSEQGDLREAAARLFEGLRYLDQLDIDTVYIEFVPDKGLGVAINDRLSRTLAD